MVKITYEFGWVHTLLYVAEYILPSPTDIAAITIANTKGTKTPVDKKPAEFYEERQEMRSVVAPKESQTNK